MYEAVYHSLRVQPQELRLEQQICPLTQTILQQAKLFPSLYLTGSRILP
jgi:hypothetical protein